MSTFLENGEQQVRERFIWKETQKVQKTPMKVDKAGLRTKRKKFCFFSANTCFYVFSIIYLNSTLRSFV